MHEAGDRFFATLDDETMSSVSVDNHGYPVSSHSSMSTLDSRSSFHSFHTDLRTALPPTSPEQAPYFFYSDMVCWNCSHVDSSDAR